MQQPLRAAASGFICQFCPLCQLMLLFKHNCHFPLKCVFQTATLLYCFSVAHQPIGLHSVELRNWELSADTKSPLCEIVFVFFAGLRQSEATYKCLHRTVSFPRVWLVCTTSPMRPWEIAVNRLPPTAPLNPRRFLGEPCSTAVHLRRRYSSTLIAGFVCSRVN